MKKLFAAGIAACVLAGCTPDGTSSDPRLEAAKAMLKELNSREVLELGLLASSRDYVQGINTAAIASIQQDPRLGAEDKQLALRKLSTMRPKIEDAVQKILSDPLLIDGYTDAMANVYADKLTVDELHQLTEFYRTPVGKKAAALMPKMAETMAKVNNDYFRRKTNALLAEIVQEANASAAPGVHNE